MLVIPTVNGRSAAINTMLVASIMSKKNKTVIYFAGDRTGEGVESILSLNQLVRQIEDDQEKEMMKYARCLHRASEESHLTMRDVGEETPTSCCSGSVRAGEFEMFQGQVDALTPISGVVTECSSDGAAERP